MAAAPASPRLPRARALWLIWSQEHGAFWLPVRRWACPTACHGSPPVETQGYTRDIDAAGRWTSDQAWKLCEREIARALNAGQQEPDVLVLAPETKPRDVLLDSLAALAASYFSDPSRKDR